MKATMRRTLSAHRRARSLSPAAAASALLPTEQLLLSGGDARLALDPASGTNKYGCASLPDDDLLAFGSSTASVISRQAFAAADELREQLQTALATIPAAQLYARQLQRIRAELLALCELDSDAGVDVVLATSGTDLHLIATQLVGQLGTGSAAAPLRAIMVEAAESGREVPLALAGRHFGDACVRDEVDSIATACGVEVVELALRDPAGQPRDDAALTVEAHALADAAVAHGRRVLLVLADVSKSGLLAPGPGCAMALKQRHGAKIEVLVDACQFRLAPATIRAYLAHGFMVALTGSKFMTGPTFSGALLIPQSLALRLRQQPVPAALAGYSTRAEWPVGWNVAALPELANFGLLLRWQAALAEMRVFHALPNDAVAHFLTQFAAAATQRLQGDERFEVLPVRPLERQPLSVGQNWDRQQTIFPFLLHHVSTAAPRQAFSVDETERVYRQLLKGMPSDHGARCQLGQPVACGARHGRPVTALRLCVSARLVAEALAHGEQRVIDRALQALDLIAAAADRVHPSRKR